MSVHKMPRWADSALTAQSFAEVAELSRYNGFSHEPQENRRVHALILEDSGPLALLRMTDARRVVRRSISSRLAISITRYSGELRVLSGSLNVPMQARAASAVRLACDTGTVRSVDMNRSSPYVIRHDCCNCNYVVCVYIRVKSSAVNPY